MGKNISGSVQARVMIGLPPEVLAGVDKAARDANTSRAAVIRQALKLYLYVADKHGGDGEVVLQKPDGTREILLVLL